MKSIEIQTIIKGLYVVITPDINNPNILEIAQDILTNRFGNEISEKDILVARDEMSNEKMIDNINDFSQNGIEKFHHVLNDLKGSVQNNKSIAYCAELSTVLRDKKTGVFKTPNLNTLLRAERKMGWPL